MGIAGSIVWILGFFTVSTGQANSSGGSCACSSRTQPHAAAAATVLEATMRIVAVLGDLYYRI